jgi:hypothetical protein
MILELVIGKILEFRAESFQWLAAPPRRREFDGTIEIVVQSIREIGKPIDGSEGQREYCVRKAHNTPSIGSYKWSSYKGLTVDTLAHRGDEGRGYLR